MNVRALPGIVLPAALTLEADFSHAIAGADIALIATTTSGLGEAAAAVHAQQPLLPLIWACKGFDRITGKLPHETIATMLGSDAGKRVQYGVLSGPSFAMEVAKGLPAALTLACNDYPFAQALAAKLERGALEDGFTLRDVRRNQWRNLTADDPIQSALDWLEDEDWLRGEVTGRSAAGWCVRTVERLHGS